MGKLGDDLRLARAKIEKPRGVEASAAENVIPEIVVKRGRRPGKHSDVTYTQTSLYLPIELRNKVRSKLYEQGKEFSGLVEGMLYDWLSKQA